MRRRTPTDPRPGRRLLWPWALGLAVTFQVLLPPRPAQAAPNPCALPFGDKLCKLAGDTIAGPLNAASSAKGAWDSAGKAIDFATDPIGYIADAIRDAVASLLKYLTELLIGSTTQIDWGNEGFLRTYTMAFAASTVLTMVYWLIAVAKRAAQGVPPLQALGESVGFLLMAVVVTAFAPAVVYYVVKLFDQAAEAMFAPVADDIASMTVTITTALGGLLVLPGGSIIVGFVGSFLLALIAGVWCELIVRNAMILTGLVFGPTVFAGLVDRALWDHTKRWISAMVAVIASKYVVLTCLALASGLLAHTDGISDISKTISTLLTAIALLCITIYLPFTIYRFIPGFGDDIQQMYQARDDFQGRAGGLKNAAMDAYDDLKERLGSAGSAAATGGATETGGPDGGGSELPGAGDLPDPDDGGLTGDGSDPPSAAPDPTGATDPAEEDDMGAPGGPAGTPDPEAPGPEAPEDPAGDALPPAPAPAPEAPGGGHGGPSGGRSSSLGPSASAAPSSRAPSAPTITPPEPPPPDDPLWPPLEEN
ncbi:hypothetical protein [Streptomyces mirabilis]|uniref:hypothetical protein n=1 Tax=Streptomyces mirabilis TaxID=68239 RepID=UPI0033F74FE7